MFPCNLRGLWLLTAVIAGVHAVLNGPEVSANEAGFVVKVFARTPLTSDSSASSVKCCAGILVSPALVLTAPECLRNSTTNADLDEIVVLVTLPGRRRARKMAAQVAERSEHWVLLQMEPLNVDHLCPTHGPKLLARLNLQPSLRRSAIVELPAEKLTGMHCHLNGIRTTDDPRDYVSERTLLQVDLESLGLMDDGSLFAPVANNVTACFEDIGTALSCQTDAGVLQVGLLRGLMARRAPFEAASRIRGKKRAKAMCIVNERMRFYSFAQDTAFVEAIEKHDFPGFVQGYHACHFMHK